MISCTDSLYSMVQQELVQMYAVAKPATLSTHEYTQRTSRANCKQQHTDGVAAGAAWMLIFVASAKNEAMQAMYKLLTQQDGPKCYGSRACVISLCSYVLRAKSRKVGQTIYTQTGDRLYIHTCFCLQSDEQSLPTGPQALWTQKENLIQPRLWQQLSVQCAQCPSVAWNVSVTRFTDFTLFKKHVSQG